MQQTVITSTCITRCMQSLHAWLHGIPVIQCPITFCLALSTWNSIRSLTGRYLWRQLGSGDVFGRYSGRSTPIQPKVRVENKTEMKTSLYRYIEVGYLDSYFEVLKIDFEIGYESVRLGYWASISKFCDSDIKGLNSEKLRYIEAVR
jgi:hypothetical protein